MGKINDLLVEATEYRMTEMCCEWDEAWDWTLEQTIEHLLEYVDDHRVRPEFTLDEVIDYYLSKDKLDDYEKNALRHLRSYKDVQDHNLHMARYV